MILNKKNFFKWLRQNVRTRNYVYKAKNRCTTCPVATFLKLHGAEAPLVGPFRYRLNDVGLVDEMGWIPLPKWATRVVQVSDKVHWKEKNTHTFGQLILDLRHAGVRP